MTTVLDLLADAAPTADDVIYVVNDPGGTPGNRKVTLGNLATALAGMAGTAYVATTGAQNVGGVKTFTSTPLIPDEVYGIAWNGKLEPATKNAIYDKIQSIPPIDTGTPLALNIYESGGVLFIDALGGASGVFADNVFTLQDNTDASKQLQLQLSGITTATLRTLTVPNDSGTIALTTGSQTLTGKTLDYSTAVDGVSRTHTVGPLLLGALNAGSTVTLDFASAHRISTFYDAGVTVFAQAAVAGAQTDGSHGSARTIRNSSGVALGLGLLRPFNDGTAIIADAAAVTVPALVEFRGAVALSIVGGGTLAVTALQSFGAVPVIGTGVTVTTANLHIAAPVVSGGVVTTLVGFKTNNVTPSGGGSIGSLYGLSIDALLGATTLNMGIRNAAALQYEPTARTIAVVGDPLTAAAVLATRYELTNSSGGSLTLTSAPTLADGVSGQVVTFLNVGAQNIVLQDQGTLPASNLRLGAATRTLGPRDSIRLAWSTGIGDWVEEFFSNVV